MNSESYLYWLYLSIVGGLIRCYYSFKDWRYLISSEKQWTYSNKLYWFYYFMNRKLFSYEQYKRWVNGNAIYTDESS